PPGLPAAPTTLIAAGTSATQINLLWTDNSSDEIRFEIERKAGSGAFQPVATTAANVAFYADTGLSGGTAYTYRVRAVSAAGPSATQVNLLWTDNSSDEIRFEIERRSGNGGFQQVATVNADATFYSDTGLAPGTTYTYRVRAANGAGASGYSNEATATTQAAA